VCELSIYRRSICCHLRCDEAFGLKAKYADATKMHERYGDQIDEADMLVMSCIRYQNFDVWKIGG